MTPKQLQIRKPWFNIFPLQQPLLVGFSLLLLASPAWGLADPIEPTITVSGDAEVLVLPDEVVIAAGVLTRAKTVLAASDENDAKVKTLREFLKKQGIEDKHISTNYMQISPVEPRESYQGYSSKGTPQQVPANNLPTNNADPFGSPPANDQFDLTVPQPIGYQVNRNFSIKISDVTKFEAIYKGIVHQGINVVNNVEFRTSQLRKLRDQARLMAVEAAQEKATAMAEKLGAKLASVQTIQEIGNAASRYGGYNSRSSDPFSSGAEASSELPGQISITAAVQVVFVLKDVEL